jgi:hypothetical protein
MRDSQGRTALHRCALVGHPVVASILVECILLQWRAGVDCINIVKGSKPQFCTAEQRVEMEQQGAWPWLWAPAFVDNSGRLPLDYVTAVQDKLVVRGVLMRFSVFFFFTNTYIHRLPRCGPAYWVHICAREDFLATTRRNNVPGVLKYSPNFLVTYCFNFLDSIEPHVLNHFAFVASSSTCHVHGFAFSFGFCSIRSLNLSVCRNGQRKIPKQNA